MLEYLVTSRARRELLKLLWLEEREASGRALASLAGITRSLADRELKAMIKAGLAHARVDGSATLYRAATDHFGAELLVELLSASSSETKRHYENRDSLTRARLAQLGAPLLVSTDHVSSASEMPAESAVVDGLELAHRDPSVARTFPVLLARRAHDLDFDQLVALATERGARQTLGFFADLTATLAGDSMFAALAGDLRDHRRSRATRFFAGPVSRFEEPLIESNTPEVAKRWHYQMNMPLEDLQAFFDKHQEA